MKENDGLENCPFCGGPAYMVPSSPHAYCENNMCVANGESTYGSQQEAAKAWNTRASRPVDVDASIKEFFELFVESHVYSINGARQAFGWMKSRGLLAGAPVGGDEHIGWAREYEGDESDLGKYMVEMCLPGDPKPDDNPNWFPLYTTPQSPRPAIPGLQEAIGVAEETLKFLQPLINAAGVPPMAGKIGVMSKIATSGAHKIKHALSLLLASRNLLAGAPVGGDARPAIPGLQEAQFEKALKFLEESSLDGCHHHMQRGSTEAAIKTVREYAARQSGVPDGWVMVPIEPTEDMVLAAVDCRFKDQNSRAIYKAMISAARDGRD
jgi:hypothetical protein